jgi:hypothetical protein
MLTNARQVHARQVLSEHEVLMLLNFELSAYDECADCHFTSVRNWRDANLQVDGEASEAARGIARKVLDEVHEAYDIE